MPQTPKSLAQVLAFYQDLGVDMLWLPAGGPQAARLPHAGLGAEPAAPPPPGTDAESCPPPVQPPEAAVSSGDSLEGIAREVSACSLCRLAQTRNRTVPGEGSHRPGILFVGEGPGQEEDRLGRPFVGPAGALLDRIIARMGLSRDRVFIANVVKCRPPGNRDPQEDEVSACLPYLRRQIALLRPRVLVALGRVPATWLLGGEQKITRIRGQVFSFEGIPLIPTYHPSYILRQQEKEAISRVKWEVWSDMQKALALCQEVEKG